MKPSRRRAYALLADLLTGIAVLVAAMAVMATAQVAHGRANAWAVAGTRCTAAARAQVDALALTGQPLPEATLDQLWPDIDVSVTRTHGTGPWAGLVLVEVTAGTDPAHALPRRSVTLARYVKPENTP